MPPVAHFPSIALNDTLTIAQIIATKNSGQPMYRLDIFAGLGRSPESSTSRQMVTASSLFGLTTGSYKSSQLALAEIGRRIVIDGDPRAKVDAVLNVPLYRKFFEHHQDSQVPGSVPAKNFLAENEVPASRTDACLEVLLQSGRDCGLVQSIGGAERIVSPQRAIEGHRTGSKSGTPESPTPDIAGHPHGEPTKPDSSASRLAMPSMHFNVEIHLPADATAETYDAIFSSMRKHLIDASE